uniref:phage tail assembly protein T n=1 Tax=Escherichia sp. MOD1-EC2449 TaxID=2093859 RepID=UPI00237BFBE0
MFDGELSFALKLAREMGRPDWRAMLAGMSSTEYADWHRFYSTHYFHDVLLDMRKRLVRTVLIFTESSDQLSRATDRVP